ncbi:M protein, serotype 24-like isoform X6 [Pomacea canaliculata]|uniref:M protein, serotype 24-like isoform X6 n=1 Tax=Pomacea canaliculata TaxID=400727 RepID=UPI000D73A73F|nr:M protein, serotype 24-like isoform X6 [Pomacea canaliculata]
MNTGVPPNTARRVQHVHHVHTVQLVQSGGWSSGSLPTRTFRGAHKNNYNNRLSGSASDTSSVSHEQSITNSPVALSDFPSYGLDNITNNVSNSDRLDKCEEEGLENNILLNMKDLEQEKGQSVELETSGYTTLKQKRPSMKAKNRSLRKQIDRAQEQLKTSEARASTLQQEVTTLTAEKESLKKQIDEVQEQLKTCQARAATLQQEVTTLTAEKESLKKQKDEVQEHLKTSEARAATLNQEVTTLMVEKDSLKSHIATVENQKATMGIHLLRSESTILELKKEVKIRDHHLQQFQGRMMEAEQQFVDMQMRLRREEENRDHQLREYHGHMEATEQQFVALQMWTQQTDSALEELRREAEVRDHQLREYHGHMVEAEQQIVAMQMRIEQSDLALVELRSEAEVRDHQLREYHEMQNDNVQKLMEKVSQKEEEARRYKLRFNRQTRKLRAVLLKKLRADRGNPKNLNIYIKNTIIQILNVRAQRASNSYSASSRRYPRSQEDHMLLGEMPLSIQNFD